ncbi:peptidase domain-containing ABC transporter [Paenibacillus xylaniclasticus]|uniref:peptidase domain-containing ABC transporter n=1 Tax=Paenibacillus xylaniclasticus TaxID=588083 RepID=UPI000FD76537|nr:MULTISPECIES: peptidase domain-containing ABC transporter [Paenibacillus]GFN31659.1 peptidase C39 [Paenibacillus curdlanolyticus]
MRKVPFIEQMSQTECGLACVAMISGYYDKHLSLFELRDRVGSGRDGNTLFELKRLSEELGFKVKCFKLDRLPELDGPVICYWEQKHFIVLERIKNGYYYILDPAHGRAKLNEEDFMAKFSRYVLWAEPGEGFVKQKPKSLWKPYLKLLFKKPRMLVFMLASNVTLQAFALISPILIQHMIDDLLVKQSGGSMALYFQGLLLALVLFFVFSLLMNETMIRVFRNVDYELSSGFFGRMLRIPYSFFQIRSTGDLMYRFSNLRSIRMIVSNQVMKSFLDCILLGVIVGYMVSKSMYLSLYIFLFVGVLYLGIYIIRPFMYEANRDELAKDTKLFSLQNESVQGMLNIKISGAENTVSDRWHGLYAKYVKSFIRRERVFGLLSGFSGALTFYIPMFIIWIGATQVSSGQMSIGELIAFQSIAAYFISTANSLIMSFETFFQLKVYLRRVQDVMDTPTESDPNRTYRQHQLEGSIRLEGVCYAYTKYADPVLKNINLNIEAGQKIAVIGASGSGKSTLANLLVGLYEPSAGRVLYDGHDLADLDKPHIRRQMGIVNQQPYLFNQTILDNIKGNYPDVGFEEVVRAAKAAQIHDEIEAMPMKYDTMLSEAASNLSGGQRQRVAIARCLVHSPKVIVFDEATNALDSINEQRIEQYLSSLACTRIIIAHRLSTVMDADQIVVMEHGQVAACGTHSELLQSSGYYQQLIAAYVDIRGLEGGDTSEPSMEKSLRQSS